MKKVLRAKKSNEKGAGIVELILVLTISTGALVALFSTVVPKMNRLDKEADILAAMRGMTNSRAVIGYLDDTARKTARPSLVLGDLEQLAGNLETVVNGDNMTPGSVFFCSVAAIVNPTFCYSKSTGNVMFIESALTPVGSVHISQSNNGTICRTWNEDIFPSQVLNSLVSGDCEKKLRVAVIPVEVTNNHTPRMYDPSLFMTYTASALPTQ